MTVSFIPSDCHPEKPRKSSRGECAGCYSKRRYTEDPEHRERVKARSRAYWAKTTVTYTEEQKERRRASQRRRYAANPRAAQSGVLKSKYGITLDDYDALLASQNGVCAICLKKQSTERRLSVDHDHTTGRVRGILCKDCNTGIGHLRDSITILESAIQYLRLRGDETGKRGTL